MKYLSNILCLFFIITSAYSAPSIYDLDSVKAFLQNNKNLQTCNLVTAVLGWHNLPYKDYISITSENSSSGKVIFEIEGLEPEWTFKYQERVVLNEPKDAKGKIEITYPYSKKSWGTYEDIPGSVIFKLGDITAKLYGKTTRGLVFQVKSQIFELISTDSKCTVKIF